MLELATQRFLRCYDDADEALRKIKDVFSLHTNEGGDLVLLNYTYSSPWCDPITRECRSLILQKGTWHMVAYPFQRFYNVQEDCADVVLPESSVCWEKVDGSLIILYHYMGKWRVATRKCVDASGSLPHGQQTFREKFLEIFYQKGYSLPDLYTDYCFMFEIVGPENRVVTPYDEDIYFIGARHIPHLKEVPPHHAGYMFGREDVNIPNSFPFESIEEVVNQKMDELGKFDEGFVICDYSRRLADGSYPRVKVKNPFHAKLAKISYSLSTDTKDMVTVVLDGLSDDARAVFSGERESKLEHVEKKIGDIVGMVKSKTKEVSEGSSSRKELAKMVSDFPFKHCVFSLIDGKYDTVSEAVFALKPEFIADWIDSG